VAEMKVARVMAEVSEVGSDDGGSYLYMSGPVIVRRVNERVGPASHFRLFDTATVGARDLYTGHSRCLSLHPAAYQRLTTHFYHLHHLLSIHRHVWTRQGWQGPRQGRR
jgi:hypothetical protein